MVLFRFAYFVVPHLRDDTNAQDGRRRHHQTKARAGQKEHKTKSVLKYRGEGCSVRA